MPGENPSATNDQEHLRLLAALRESEILRELAELLASSLDLNHILQILVKRAAEVCGVERCTVWLLEETRGVFLPATYHLATQQIDRKNILSADHIWYHSSLPFDNPVIRRLLDARGMLALENLYAEPSMRAVAETFLVRSVLLVALLREGRPVGMMSLDDPDKLRTFSPEQQQLARAIGQQAALAIDNARLYQQVQEERKRAEQLQNRLLQALETMLHVAEAVSGITDIKDILRAVLARTLTTLNCDRGIVQLYDREQQVFTPLLSLGFSAEAETPWLTEQSTWTAPVFNHDHEFRTHIMAGHATVIHAQECPAQPNSINYIAVLAAPITHNERLLGLMMLDRSPTGKTDKLFDRERHEFTIWDMAVVEGVAQLAGLAIEQARWQQEAINARTSEAVMREANALKDEFLAITAHEFRTPLTVILAHSQLALRMLRKLADQGPLNSLNENLSTIEEQARQLTNIVNTFLEVTQINRGQLMLNFDTVDLAGIAKQAVTNHSATSAVHQIRCIVTPCEHPYLVKGDSARLLQILANLLQNAIKYSPAGGPITVSLRQFICNENKQNIEVRVEDKGIGISKEAQSHLFERFYRAPDAEGSKTRGIGLGLYVVAELLYLHGGTIRVESSGIPGEGSDFILTLPAVQESEMITSDGTLA